MPVQYWKKPLGGSQGQILESVNPKIEGMDELGARKTPFFFFSDWKDGTSFVKLVDTAPGSSGKGSSFPFSLDKGQAWEAPAVCGWGEDTGKLRAEGWSWELRPDLPLSRATRPVHTS